MELTRPTGGELLAGGAGLTLFLLSFFDLWGTYRVGAGDFELSLSFSLWDGYGFLPKFGVLLGLIAAALVGAGVLGWRPVPPQTHLGLGAMAVACMLVGIAAGPADGGRGELSPDVSYEIARGALAFVAILPAVAMVAGGWLHLRASAALADAVAPRTEPPPRDLRFRRRSPE